MYLVYLYLLPLQYLIEAGDEVNYNLYLVYLYLPPLQYLIEAADEVNRSVFGVFISSTFTVFDRSCR